jgi:hypothetical protein
MTRIPSWLMAIIAVVLAVLGGRAISAQDKYTVQTPNGLAFSEFRGYEDWQVVAVSHTEDAKCGAACHEIAAAKDYIFTTYGHR